MKFDTSMKLYKNIVSWTVHRREQHFDKTMKLHNSYSCKPTAKYFFHSTRVYLGSGVG